MDPIRLAWRNLSHHRVRTLVAAAGVSFAVLLMFLQLGFYLSVRRTATMLFDHLRFDLVLVSSEHQDLTRMTDFSRGRLTQARAAPGVEAVTPVLIGSAGWRNPALPPGLVERLTGRRPDPAPGSGSTIFMLGVPPAAVAEVFRTGPDDGVFPDPAAAAEAGRRLARGDAVLLDRMSRPEFGSYALFRDLPTAEVGPRVNGRRVEVVGEFALGTGFSWKGMLITGEETFARAAYRGPDKVSLGLVGVAAGADPGAVKAALERALPADIRVFTRAEATGLELDYWVSGNSLGELLAAGAVLAVVVGAVFLYQMMAADIRSRLPEYATAKALGYRPGYLRAVVLWQAVLLAGCGFLPGATAAAGLYEVARSEAGLPMAFHPVVAAVVLATTVGMCVGSGLAAVRKALRADPAALF